VKHLTKFSASLTLASISILCVTACMADSMSPRKAQAIDSGRMDYQTHCASCHGSDGKGSGAVAEFLTIQMPDLTLLSLTHGGKYPEKRVYALIDGRVELLVHGRREMPVWGDTFRLMEGEDPEPVLKPQNSTVIQRIDDLVAYIGSIQK